MSTVIKAPEAPLAGVLPLARLSIDQYHRMIESGVLAEDERVELIEGYLVRKMTKNPPHRVAVGLLDDLLTTRMPSGWHVANRDPVTLDHSEPEPDLSVVRGKKTDYRDRHPGPADVALIVEVADSSLAQDRVMAAVYARNRIPVYWIVDINGDSVEVYREPEGSGEAAKYAHRQQFGAGQSIPLIVDGEECAAVPVDDFLSDL